MTTTTQDIRQRVDAVIASAAADPSMGVRAMDVVPVTEAVVAQVAPIVAHVTNTEPWYQSRVTLGSLLAILASLLAAFGYTLDAGMQKQILDAVVAIAPLVGGAFALYGRWKAKKPLGS